LLTALLLMAASAAPAKTTAFPAPAGTGGRTLDIYTSTDLWAMRPLIEDFQQLRPRLGIRYHQLTTQAMYRGFLAAARHDNVQADLLISSAMDLQTKLANDGYAQAFYPENSDWLPTWAHWRHRVFGFTFEPAVIAYDPRRLSADEVPRTRYDLIALLRDQPERFRGRVGSYDIRSSGVGYLLATQDALQSSTYGRLIESFGRIRVQPACCTLDVFKAVENGDLLIGYNLLGSYLRAQIAAGSPLRMVLPKDYTLVLSRTALIPEQAPDPRLGGLFLDYLLSLRGQRVVARQSYLFALHPALHGPGTANNLRARADGPLRPIRLGPALLVYLDPMKRARFLDEWRASVNPVTPMPASAATAAGQPIRPKPR